jgi:iron(III) transport system permease protein
VPIGFVLLAIVVAYLSLVPVVTVLLASLRTTPVGLSGPVSLDNYAAVLSSPTLLPSLKNTAVFAGGSTAVAVLVGTYFAWLTERTDVRVRPVIYAAVVIPIFVPGILTTIAWYLILNERIGIANAVVAWLTGRTEPFFDAFTMSAMIWTDGADSFTLPFLLMAAAFRSMDPALEEASGIAGANRIQTLSRVTLPLMWPALGASVVLVFLKTIDNFQVPVILGLPAGIRVLATDVYIAARLFPVDLNTAATYAVVYLCIAFGCLWVYWRLVGSTDRFTTIAARGYRAARLPLGSWRRMHEATALTLVTLIVLLPLAVMAYTSLLTYYRPPHAGVWSEFTLRSYQRVLFEMPVSRRAARNNLVAGGGAALVTAVLGSLVAWYSVRSRLAGRRIVDAIGTAPIAFPGLVISVAVLWFYLHMPLPIYATLWAIGIAYVTAFLPYTIRATTSSLAQLSPELEEASAMAGAPWRTTFVRIVVPLTRPALIVGALYVLSRSFQSLSLPILLAGPANEVVPVLVYNLQQSGRYPELNALGILVSGFLLVVTVAVRLTVGRFGDTAGGPLARMRSVVPGRER